MLVVAGVDQGAVACIRIGKMRGARSVPRCVRIGSQIGWLGSRNLLFYRLVYPVCEDWLTQWVVGRSESTVLSVLVLGL